MDHDLGQLISRYIDNEVTQKERDQLEPHLKECKKCKGLYDQFVANDNLIVHSLKYEIFGNQLTENVIRKIKARNTVKAATFLITLRKILPSKKQLITAIPFSVACTAIAYLVIQLYDANNTIKHLNNAISTQSDVLKAADQQISTKDILLTHQGIKQIAERNKIAAYQNSDFTLIAAKFESNFDFYKVFKRKNGGEWIEISPYLTEPSFTDYDTDPGIREYQFEGYKNENGKQQRVKSAIIQKEIKGKTLKLINYDEKTKKATFSLKDVNSKETKFLSLELNSQIPVENFRLERISESDKVIYFTIPVFQFDDHGKPVLDPSTGDYKILRIDSVPVATNIKAYKAELINTENNSALIIWQGEETGLK
ncbi:MAG: zf-HC2 domain-containing protein [Planctomycetes bacterium]|nr:zf-HC2 domain-containing protein [Planctomycetota bacterium]